MKKGNDMTMTNTHLAASVAQQADSFQCSQALDRMRRPNDDRSRLTAPHAPTGRARPSCLLIAAILVGAATPHLALADDAPPRPETTLWYAEPANSWEREALPIGNGRLGAMIFGGTAAIAEMLMQSHGDVIRLLPALPDAWPSGKVVGLRARGAYQVDITWKDGKVTGYRIASKQPGEVTVRVNGQTKTVMSEKL